ncbi:MAG TPA: hypothetical protein DEP84_12875 [Chloroflexi bacterium]|nr:hypothetical protein [Chloroflexota bacterium]
MHIALLAHSLQHNNIGRLFPVAQMLEQRSDLRVTIVGIDHGGARFPLLADLHSPVIALPSGRGRRTSLEAAIQGHDVLHVFKNRPFLLEVLEAVAPTHQPVILDLDDWELGAYLQGLPDVAWWRQLVPSRFLIARIQQWLALDTASRQGPRAMTVNSTTLRALFGGELFYTPVDLTRFDPGKGDRHHARARFGLALEDEVIGFLGTPHPYKGFDLLLTVYARLKAARPRLRLLVTGVPAENPYRERLSALPGVILTGYLPLADYPAAYLACDVLPLPQQPNLAAVVQTPLKLLLGMAMQRAMVVSAVGDMPAVVGDAGIILPADDPDQWAAALASLLDNAVWRAQIGGKARARLLGTADYPTRRRQLLALYARVLDR